MFHYFSFIFGGVITLIMLVPFGVATMYAAISLKQLIIADKEKNKLKTKSGVKALLFSVTGIIVLIFLWLILMSKI